jgi:hypothetical protein
MVREGKTVEDIKTELRIKTTLKIKNLYLEGLIEAGIIPELKEKERIKKPIDIRKIEKHGTLLINRKLVIGMLGFKEGDQFKVRREKNSIILEKL